MSASTQSGTTAELSAWAANFKLDDAPTEVVERMKALVLDFLRVVTVGAPLPWSRAARGLILQLSGKAESSLVLCGSKVDVARAAFVNGAYAHACDLDDTHVGSMHHAGASILPAVLAVAERDNCDGRTLLTAAIIGYEASLRIGLATQPALFQRGFMATPTCGAMGAALAVGKCLNFNEKDMAGALGAAGAYAGGLAQFYLSGGVTKRLNGARGAESGVMAALLTQAGIWGPRDILEGEAGFFKAFSGDAKAEKITGDLGSNHWRGFRMMEVSTKIHAGAGRLQATVDAGLALGFEYKLTPDHVIECEVGIPKVVQGRLTQLDPPDLQSAQLSIPFSLAMALGLGKTRGAQASLRSEDYDVALTDAGVRALSNRTRCVLDAWVEAGTNTEEVPTRVTIKLAGGATHELKIAHPRGSPHRRMAWPELVALFNDTVGDALPADRLDKVQKLVATLDQGSSVRELMNTFVATPAWLAT